jgi:hypothetical protein
MPLRRTYPILLVEAAGDGDLPEVQRIVRLEGLGSFLEPDEDRAEAICFAQDTATQNFHFSTAQWLLEYEGGPRSLSFNNAHDQVSWDMMLSKYDASAAATSLLRVMLLSSGPSAISVRRLFLGHLSIVLPLLQEGTRLRMQLPAYLAQRRALLDEHCPLIAPLQAIVSSYEEPTTTEELWATGLGALPGDAAPSWAVRMRTRIRTQPRVEARQEGWRNCCCCFWRPWSCD